MGTRLVRGTTAVIAALSTVALASCSSGADPDPSAGDPAGTTTPTTTTTTPFTEATGPYRVPDAIRSATAQWVAAPDVDLFEPRAVATRAAAESRFVALYTGLENAYRGFPTALTTDMRELFLARETTTGVTGTVRFLLAGIHPTADGFVADVCEDRGAMSETLGDGDHFTIDAPPTAFTFTVRGTGGPTVAPQVPPVEPGATTWQAPFDDVFGGWADIDIRTGAEPAKTACAAWIADPPPPAATPTPGAPAPGDAAPAPGDAAPADPPATPRTPTSRHSPTPTPAEPAFPGWPIPAS